MVILPCQGFCDQRFALLFHVPGDSLLMCVFLVWKQLTAEWAWASAMICASQSLHKFMHKEVR